MTQNLSRSINAVTRAEASLDRFAQLKQMDPAQLAALFGGDPAHALPWVRAAAIHGVAAAQTRLGRMLLEGTGIPKNEVSALQWFLRAAGSGCGDAMNMVGRCYENGWAVAADEGEAALWYRRSAAAGHDWGAYNYAHMLFDGRGGQPLDRAAALKFYVSAADKGHARAMNLAGRCFEAGWGIKADLEVAEEWYRLSAEAGYFRGQYNHAMILMARGETAAARQWLERAYANGDAAMRKIIRAGIGPDARQSGAGAGAGKI